MDTIPPHLQDQLARAQPRVRRLVERNRSDTAWGYGIYDLPSVLEGANSLEEVQEKHDRLLDWAKQSVGCAEWVRQIPPFYLQPLRWPTTSSTTTRLTTSARARLHFMKRLDAQALVPKPPGKPNAVQRIDWSWNLAYDADAALIDTFKQLRIDFKQIRATRADVDIETRNQPVEGLLRGSLDNVFIVVDEYSAWSSWDIKPADSS